VLPTHRSIEVIEMEGIPFSRRHIVGSQCGHECYLLSRELSYHGNLWGGSSIGLNTEGLLKFGNNCGAVNKHCALKIRAASVIVWRITLQL
jgi:hypothetical protein